MSKRYIKLPKLNGQKVRKKYYITNAVRHPAKADIPMMIWILERFVKDGDIVLDPMAGVGTTLLEGIRLFPNSLFIGIELEHKFVKWCNASIKKTENIARENWFMEIGKAVCVQGDAKELEKVLNKKVNKIISSPPYAKSLSGNAKGKGWEKLAQDPSSNRYGRKSHPSVGQAYSKDKNNIGNLDYGKADKIITSPPWGGQVQHKTNYLGKQKQESGFEYSEDPENIGNLPHGKVDKIVSSPPYGEGIGHGGGNQRKIVEEKKLSLHNKYPAENKENIGNLPHGKIDKIVTSPPYSEIRMDGGAKDRAGMRPYTDEPTNTWQTQRDQRNIGNLKHGRIDKIITSPPFGQAQSGGGIAKKGYTGNKHSPTDLVGKRAYMPENVGEDKENISNLPYVDKVISSPPYSKDVEPHTEMRPRAEKEKVRGYSESQDNIGKLNQQTYLQAMFLVYQQCFKVLKPDGLMVLITKDFIRNKKRVQLGEDTIKLCEMAGFKHIHTYHRKIENPSFWRILYQQKNPEVEQIDCEDILCFRKENEN